MGTQYEAPSGRVLAKSMFGGKDKGPVFRIYCEKADFYPQRLNAVMVTPEDGHAPARPLGSIIPMMTQSGYAVEWGADPHRVGVR